MTEGVETEEDIDKQIEFHKKGQAAVNYQGPMNKKHAAKIRELLAKKEAMKKQDVAEGLLNNIADKVMGAAPRQPKYRVGQRVRYETSPHQPDWKDGGSGVGVITDYKNGHYMINGNPVNHFEIKGVVGQDVAEAKTPEEFIDQIKSLNTKQPRVTNTCKKCGKKWQLQHHCKGASDKNKDDKR